MSPRALTRRPSLSRPVLTLIPLGLSTACWGSKSSEHDASVAGPEVAVVTVDRAALAQTLEGFGAAVAWYGSWYTNHPSRDELKTVLFRELGLDILRLRNQHRAVGDQPDPEGLAVYQDATESLGAAPRVLLSSWSPPLALKKNDSLDCSDGDPDCTLKPNDDGSFPYAAFGEYWADSLEAYAAIGILPYYVSIQNEPDFVPSAGASWEACRFEPTESDDYPGYDQAFSAVVESLSARNIEARLLGPETLQISNTKVERYLANVEVTQLYGVNHHLYDGTNWRNPLSYGNSMAAVANAYPGLPRFQTEFSPTDSSGGANQSGFEVAWLIHETLVVEGASAYLHWDLVWDGSGLVNLENPWAPTSWNAANGYRVNPAYYALRHYARYTNPGDRVVASASTLGTVMTVAFISEDARRLTVVLLNRATTATGVTLELGDFSPRQSLRVESVVDPNATEADDASEFWQTRAPLSGSTSEFELAPRSITTVVATLDDALPS